MAQVQGPQANVQNRPIPIGPFNPEKTHSEIERWICIYPAYLNSKKTRQEGRIIPKDKAVENPSWKEICDVLKAAGYEPVAENKQYPRERSKEIEYRGRVRVQLKKDDGEPLIEQFPTRDAIISHVAEMIPQLKSRTSKPSSGTSGNNESQQPTQNQGGKKNKKKK